MHQQNIAALSSNQKILTYNHTKEGIKGTRHILIDVHLFADNSYI